MSAQASPRLRRRLALDTGFGHLMGSHNENLFRFMASFCLLFRSSLFAAGRLWRRLGRFNVRAIDNAFHACRDATCHSGAGQR
jgi:hypothetical protein